MSERLSPLEYYFNKFCGWVERRLNEATERKFKVSGVYLYSLHAYDVWVSEIEKEPSVDRLPPTWTFTVLVEDFEKMIDDPEISKKWVAYEVEKRVFDWEVAIP